MNAINVYLVFNGNCSEAMTFYQSCLGGELTQQLVAESPMADQWPADAQQNILHAMLVSDGMVLFGSDMMEGVSIEGNTVNLSLNSSSKKAINQYYTKLSNGGTALRPMHSFFAGSMGALIDKYTKTWLLYSDNSQD